MAEIIQLTLTDNARARLAALAAARPSVSTSHEYRSIADWVRACARRARERAQMRAELHRMSDEQLADFGLTRSEAARMAHRPFWKP